MWEFMTKRRFQAVGKEVIWQPREAASVIGGVTGELIGEKLGGAPAGSRFAGGHEP
jgi:hypothetical protein